MNIFIKLTNPYTNKPEWVNPKHIERIKEEESDLDKKFFITKIDMASSSRIAVKERPEDILKLIPEGL